jgi:hypothetical protein
MNDKTTDSFGHHGAPLGKWEINLI